MRGEPLCDAFRVAQHARWIGGLVSRDVHETFNTELLSHPQEPEGSPDVALECFGRVLLQKRKVLQRGRVKDDFWSPLDKDVGQRAQIANIGEDGAGVIE